MICKHFLLEVEFITYKGIPLRERVPSAGRILQLPGSLASQSNFVVVTNVHALDEYRMVFQLAMLITHLPPITIS